MPEEKKNTKTNKLLSEYIKKLNTSKKNTRRKRRIKGLQTLQTFGSSSLNKT